MKVERGVAVTAADGVRLLVDHYHPAGAPTGPGAAVWIRTPYGRKGMSTVARQFAKRGAHVLVEAIRGTDGSGGHFDGVTFAPGDGEAVSGWLRSQPWYGGTVVTWGLSAIGYASWALAGMEVPGWRAAILQDAESELRDAVIYPGGAFAGAVVLGFVSSVEWQARHPKASLPRTLLAGVRSARRNKRALDELPLGAVDERLFGHRVEHFQQWLDRAHDDAYWQALNRRLQAPGMPDEVHLASGWHDVCLASTLADFAALRDAGKSVRLVVGPWTHARGFRDRAYTGELDACIDAAIAGKPLVAETSVRVHVGGADEWRELPDWPPPGYRPVDWHLRPGGGLATEPAPESAPDTYRYDPADPTPAVGGAMENWDGSAGAKDNRRLERRSDVLTYTSDPLAADIEVVGPVSAEIVFRSSTGHTDVFARLCDVDPRGRSTNLCDGIRRICPDDPPAAADGTRTVTVDLIGTAHRFRAGHRIRLQVSSGAHPRFVRNPGTGEPLATAVELRTADQEVFHDPAHRSTLRLPTRV